MTFRDLALRAVNRGFSVIPCDVRDKGPYGLNARNKALTEARATLPKDMGNQKPRLSREQISEIYKRCPMKGIFSKTNTSTGVENFAKEISPEANYGICSDENYIIFETDDRKRLTELLPQTLPRTFTVSARANRGYFIFKQTERSRAVEGILEVAGLFELRNNGYCVGYGSIHPETGKEYALVCDAEPAPFPDWLLEALQITHRESPTASGVAGTGEVDKDALTALLEALHKRGEPKDMLGMPNVAITSLHPTLKALAAHLYKGPDSSQDVIDTLWGVGQEYCTDREPAEKDIDDIVSYMERKNFEPCYCRSCEVAKDFNLPPAFADGLHIFGTEEELKEHLKNKLYEDHKANEAVVIDLAEIQPTETANPVYPNEVWEGTEYAEFADLCQKGNHIPREFFIEAIKTVTGAVVGRNLRAAVEGGLPRFYTVLLNSGGSGKGVSIKNAISVFREGWGGAPLLWSPRTKIEDVGWTTAGACKVEFSSAPGMQRTLESGQDRWLQIHEELSSMVESTKGDGYGETLQAAIRQLYDGEDFTTTATAKRDACAGTAQHSLLAGTTPQLWEGMFAKTQAEGSGLFQRFNLIAGGRVQRVGTLRTPILGEFSKKMTARVETLQAEPICLSLNPEAVEMIDSWFEKLSAPSADGSDPDPDEYGRLNVLAWRNALHLAWMRGSPTIGLKDAEKAVRLSNYQHLVRIKFKPATGEHSTAILEERIRRIVNERGKIGEKEARSTLNGNRAGLGVWANALRNLITEGDIVRVEEKMMSGQLRKWLTRKQKS